MRRLTLFLLALLGAVAVPALAQSDYAVAPDRGRRGAARFPLRRRRDPARAAPALYDARHAAARCRRARSSTPSWSCTAPAARDASSSARNSPTCCSDRASRSTSAATTSSCPTASATENPPSRRDGLRMRFPNYDYDDMVAAQRRAADQGLGVSHAAPRSWARRWAACTPSSGARPIPTSSDALMPLACLPTEIAGRNRMWRAAADARPSTPIPPGQAATTRPSPLRACAPPPACSSRRLRADLPAEALIRPATRPTPIRRPRSRATSADRRRQRPDLPGRVVAHLRSLDEPREDQGADDLDQLADDFINPPELGLAERRSPACQAALHPHPAPAATRAATARTPGRSSGGRT